MLSNLHASMSITTCRPAVHHKKIPFLACCTVLSASRYRGSHCALKTYRPEALQRVCKHYGSQRSAAMRLGQKESMLWDLLPFKHCKRKSHGCSYLNCKGINSVKLHFSYCLLLPSGHSVLALSAVNVEKKKK